MSTHSNISLNITTNCHQNECNLIEINATNQSLTLLLFITVIIITGVCMHFLKYFWIHRTEYPIKEPIILIISYFFILLSLFIATFSLFSLYWVPVEPPRNTIEGSLKWTHSNGEPIYFSEIIDYVLRYTIWTLFLLFFNLRIYQIVTQINDDAKCRKFAFLFLFLLPLILISILAFARINNEQIALIILCFSEFIFVSVCIWKYAQADDEAMGYLKRSWSLSLLLMIGWFILLIVDLSVRHSLYLSLRLCAILLFAAWIALFCYSEKKRTASQPIVAAKHRALSIENTDLTNENEDEFEDEDIDIGQIIKNRNKISLQRTKGDQQWSSLFEKNEKIPIAFADDDDDLHSSEAEDMYRNENEVEITQTATTKRTKSDHFSSDSDEIYQEAPTTKTVTEGY